MYPKPSQIWKHYKTQGEYEIIGIGQMQVKFDALDMKKCVIYKAVSDGTLWTRPLEDFIENVETLKGSVSRFTLVVK